MNNKYNQEDVEAILDRCYFEFCEILNKEIENETL